LTTHELKLSPQQHPPEKFMQTYSHSGTVPMGAAISTLLVAAVTASVGGIIYAYAFHWIPFVYINFLITLGFGIAIGSAVSIMARRGKIRSNTFLWIASVLAALFGIYIYWAAYLWALAGIGNIGLTAFWPPALVAFGQLLFDQGSWGIKDLTITGWFLVAFWVAEVGVILWMATSIALTNARLPFCEACNDWTDEEQGVAKLTATGQEPAWQQVLSGDLPSLAEFPPAEQSAKQFVRLDVARCPRCEQSRFLTVHQVQITVDKKGNETTKETPLVVNAVLTPSQFAVVEACAELYRQAPPQQLSDPTLANAGDSEPPQPPAEPSSNA
jgi:hypothetical protein